MMIVRAVAVWFLIILAESIHGTLRTLFLAPLVGDFPARRISFFVGVLIIFAITYLCIGWIRPESEKTLFFIGLLWSVLTGLFEFGLGFLIMGYSRERVFEDYDLSRGGLMGFGLLFMIFTPWLAAKTRRIIKVEGS